MNTKVIFRPIIIRVHNHVNQSDAEAVVLLSYPAKQVFPCNNKAETAATQAIAVAKGGKHLRQDKTVFDFPPIG